MSDQNTALVPVDDSGPLKVFFNKDSFDLCWRSAKLISMSQLVPKRFQGKVEDCFLALSMARSLGVIPMMVMSEIYVVFGTPSMSGKMVAGLVNASGLFDDPLNYRFSEERPAMWCEAYTTRHGREYSVRVEWDAHVVASGWDKDKKEKDSDRTVPSKWRTMREQMFRYRSASWFGKAFAPQVMLGMQTREELEDEAGMVDQAIVTIDAKVPDVVAEKVAALDAQVTAPTAADQDRMGPVDDNKPTPAPHPAGPEFEPKAAAPKAAGRKRSGRQVEIDDKTLNIQGEELTRLAHAIETSGKLGDQQTAVDYAIQVLGIAELDDLSQLTRQQAEVIFETLSK